MSDVTNTDMQVLVVDDEPHLRDSLSQSLMLADYRTRPLASAEQALAILRAEAPFEGVVITDIRMPGMDGLRAQAADKARNKLGACVKRN